MNATKISQNAQRQRRITPIPSKAMKTEIATRKRSLASAEKSPKARPYTSGAATKRATKLVQARMKKPSTSAWVLLIATFLRASQANASRQLAG
jgi:hypothetical protein